MKATAPEYSIIVPTYRRREALGRCLNAIAALDFPRDAFELLVVDDGSPSPPADLVARVRPAIDAQLISCAHAGPASARNAGARFARGRYLVFTDDDCAPESDWLTAIDRWTTSSPPLSAIGGRTVNLLSDNIYATASQAIVDYLYDYYGDHPAPSRFFTTNNLAVPRAQFMELGGFDEGFRLAAAEDRDLCERWLAEGMPLSYARDVVVQHSHTLGLMRFNRQHFNYGRGAFDLHRSRARRGEQSLRLEPTTFYSGLITYPFRHSRGWRAAVLSMLHFWSQIAYAAGYFFERALRGWRLNREERRPRRIAEPRIVGQGEDRSASARQPSPERQMQSAAGTTER